MREYLSHLLPAGDTKNWKYFVDYTYRGDALLAGYVSPTAEQRHFDLDHLGSVRLVTNLSGNLTARHDYLPYGEQVSAFGEGDRKRWAGHERDYAVTTSNQDDLDYMHARHYSPRNGRFIVSEHEKLTP